MGLYDGLSTSTLSTYLSEAHSALHALMTGTKAVQVRFNDGKTVQYTLGNIEQLKSYISSLQNAIAIANGGSTQKPYSVATWSR